MEASSTFDPVKPPTITLSNEEMAEMQAQVDLGLLPKDYIDRYADAVDANVFGHDAPKDKNGWRLEQGLGSSRNQTAQSLAAYIRWCGPGKPNEDPHFEKNLARMQRELDECNARRAKEASNNQQFVLKRGRV
jgi:hypothetical protein